MDEKPVVVLVGKVVPRARGTKPDQAYPPSSLAPVLGISQLRTLLATMSARWGWTHRGAARGYVLGLLGGWSGHLHYAAPLLEAVGGEACAFIPLWLLGRVGHLEVADLKALGAFRGMRLGVDLGGVRSSSTAALAEALEKALLLIQRACGYKPDWVWAGQKPLDARMLLLARRFGLRVLVGTGNAFFAPDRVPSDIRLLGAIPGLPQVSASGAA